MVSEIWFVMLDFVVERMFYEVLFFFFGGVVFVGFSGIFLFFVILIEVGFVLKYGGKCWKIFCIILNYFFWSSCNLVNSCFILLFILNKLFLIVWFIFFVLGNV